MINLTFQKKKIILIIAMALVCYIAYQLSFKHTFTAFKLNKELQKEKTNITSLDGSFPQVSRANTFYLVGLKGYNVKQEDRETRLWQSVSGMAIVHDVSISFGPNLTVILDTVAAQKGMVKQQFAFKANYFNLVKLLDTISKSKEIGKIADLRMFTKKEAVDNNSKGELTMNLTLVGVER